jgi:hypothetical protein
MPVQVFVLRAVPRRLMRSLVSFAGAGTLMAALVYRDGSFGHLLPLVMLVACWFIPFAFWAQIRKQGYDPLERMLATEAGLEAHYKAEGVRFVPWSGMRRLIQIAGYRYRAWTIITDDTPLHWFGELAEPDAFAILVADRTGLAWELESQLPANSVEPKV